MTDVTITPVRDIPGATEETVATFQATAMRSETEPAVRVDGAEVTFPSVITALYRAGEWTPQPALSPLPANCHWRVVLQDKTNGRQLVRTVILPVGNVAPTFGQLVDVHPDSGETDPDVSTWQAILDGITEQSALAVDAAVTADAAKDITLAESSAAGTSAFNAGQSAATALGHKNDAAGSASAAGVAKDAAAASAASVNKGTPGGTAGLSNDGHVVDSAGRRVLNEIDQISTLGTQIETPGSAANLAVIAVAGSGGAMAEIEAAARIGDGWHVAALAPPPAADTPVVTISTASTIGSGVTVPPVTDMEGARFRYDGTPSLVSAGTDLVVPPSAAYVTYTMCPEFVTEAAATVVEVKFKASSTEIALRIVVNGAWLTEELTRFTGLTSGTVYFVKLTFPSSRKRQLRVETASDTMAFGGVVVASGQTVTRPAKAVSRRLVVVTDSYGGGAGVPPLGASRRETYPNYLAKLFECDSLWNLGAGGTGWVASANPFPGRVTAAIAAKPDILLFMGSRNDGTAYLPTVYNAALAGLSDAVNAGVPLVLASGPSTAGFAAGNEAIRAAALDAGVRFIDGIGGPEGPWIDSTDLPLDGIHPDPEGHHKITFGFYDQHGPLKGTIGAKASSVTTTTTALTVSPTGAAGLGTTVTLHATVNPAAAGSVQFKEGATVLGTVAAVAGEATFTTTSLTLGSHSLTARFVPTDAAAFGVSTSPSVSYIIDPAPLTSIITTNLLADIDAASITPVATGTKVTTITPSAGTETASIPQATTSLQPTYVASDTNGKAAIKFVPSQRLGPVAWAAPHAIPNTVFNVFRLITPTTTGNSVVTGGDASVGAEILREALGVWQILHGASAPAPLPNQPAASTSVVVVATVFEGATSTVFFNTKASPQTVLGNSGGSVGGLSSKAIGGFAGGSAGGEKNIYRDISYSGRMADADIRRMMDYLAGVYSGTLVP